MNDRPFLSALRKPLTLLLLSAGLLVTGCATEPYVRPTINLPAAFKEAPAGWKFAQAADTAPRGAWWAAFADPQLDTLLAQVDAANFNLRLAEANWRKAAALGRQARAALFPLLTTQVQAAASNAHNTQGQLDATWDTDLWGRLHGQAQAQDATTQSALADLANTRLGLQAELAADYFALRVADAQTALLGEIVAADDDALKMTRNRYAAGVVSRADVAQAETQWLNVRTQAEDVAINRAQLEHAMAVLVGRAPADFSLAALPAAKPADTLSFAVPALPPVLPSELLERRPDIASAERQVAAASAGVGAARAALFPSLGLSLSGAATGHSLGDLLKASNIAWVAGATLAATIFDAGAREAGVDQAQAAYDASVATYRQSVLGALQSVEDQLVALRMLDTEAALQSQAVTASGQALTLTMNQYRAGTVPYLNVLTAQTAEQNARLAALNLTGRKMTALVQLVTALGGGWTNQPVVSSADARSASTQPH